MTNTDHIDDEILDNPNAPQPGPISDEDAAALREDCKHLWGE